VQLTELLNQLEEILSDGYYIPLTGKAIVDQDKCLDLIDRIRASLPSELAEAQRIKRARERILSQAEAEANDLRRLSRERLEQAAAESEAVRLARVQADQIVQEGELKAREMAAAALEYCTATYARLEADLDALLHQVRRLMAESADVKQ